MEVIAVVDDLPAFDAPLAEHKVEEYLTTNEADVCGTLPKNRSSQFFLVQFWITLRTFNKFLIIFVPWYQVVKIWVVVGGSVIVICAYYKASCPFIIANRFSYAVIMHLDGIATPSHCFPAFIVPTEKLFVLFLRVVISF